MNRLSSSTAQRNRKSRINRAASPWRAAIVPYATIMLGSLLPALLLVDAMPILPPLGFILLLCWRIMRPGLLPLWVGVPLGLFDDLYSGQLIGSAVLLWSLTMIALEVIETRFPWRGFWQDWFTASLVIILYIAGAMLLSGATSTPHQIVASGPQIVLSILMYPFITLLVARLDQFRLAPSRRVG